MSTAIVSAAVCDDTDTGSYFELAARAGRSCLERAEVTPEQVGLLVNAGVFRDSNISEPAIAALIQKRLGVGLEYKTGRLPAFSFDVMNGGTGFVHALQTAHCFLAPGEVEYALVVAGDTHPSTDRAAQGFPYHAGAGAMLLRSTPESGGFGRLHATQPQTDIEPTAWADLGAAGTNGRSALTVRTGAGDPLGAVVEVVRAAVREERLGRDDFASGAAVLLAPAPAPDFREQLAARLNLPLTAVAGVDPALGDPYSAAPVHAFLTAVEDGLLDTARTVLFVAADADSAACLAHRIRPLVLIGSANGMRAKQVDV
ncbi:hypothetical protein IU500_34565 [Nocardia terpenica]|uniref:hypothetical protein n=1 Tax=Nocardia terpenica TaxID=455432 RepID=UPI0002FC781A|nr:hypothetical protein [Nocardia terpenica]MBF6065458.1 hypothetical protein [Nocardia terpenica]MBF6109140.1 hypothetical protein [Nocardia terpenica]MBF6114658.1 hypothetical protein [Nocardia terpenica]MBF6123343.1 hypothetical protein [Nocardia terpenica]MBF6156639.1 hypothetical protein [Nocardia terpenica]